MPRDIATPHDMRRARHADRVEGAGGADRADGADRVGGAGGAGRVGGAGRADGAVDARRAEDGSELIDFEELYPLVADPAVTDVLVLGDRGVWVDDGGGLRRVDAAPIPERRARTLATALIARGGRHVDESAPCADVRSDGGIRVHVVLAPVSRSGTAISVRLPRVGAMGLTELDAAGTFDRIPVALVRRAVLHRRNVLVTGGTGTGKTTLLAAMLAEVPADERIVVIEDVGELRVDHPHVVALEARQANAERAGAIGVDRLLREALRMRPDRIVVGECRGAEIRELMGALNTGHDGGAGTLHANGIEDVPARLEALGALAGLDPPALARQAVSAFDLVLHLVRGNGRRRVAAVGRLVLGDGGRLDVVTDVRG